MDGAVLATAIGHGGGGSWSESPGLRAWTEVSVQIKGPPLTGLPPAHLCLSGSGRRGLRSKGHRTHTKTAEEQPRTLGLSGGINDLSGRYWPHATGGRLQVRELRTDFGASTQAWPLTLTKTLLQEPQLSTLAWLVYAVAQPEPASETTVGSQLTGPEPGKEAGCSQHT